MNKIKFCIYHIQLLFRLVQLNEGLFGQETISCSLFIYFTKIAYIFIFFTTISLQFYVIFVFLYDDEL